VGASPEKVDAQRHHAAQLPAHSNAPTESLWSRLKVGRLYGRRYATRRQAMDEVVDWLTFYNHKRLHSTLGYVSPMTFEHRWIAAQQQDRKSA
jgi:transposase InsO family protein